MSNLIRVLVVLNVLLLCARSAPAALLAHWTFDSTGPERWDDSAGSNHGVVVGSPAQSAGIIGLNALELDGTASYLNVGSGAGFDTHAYTISAWLRPNVNSGWRTAVGSWQGAGAYWMHYGLDGSGGNAGKFSNYVSTNTGIPGVVSTTTVPAGNTDWYHVVSVANPFTDRLQLWVNGVLESETAVPGWTSTQLPGVNNVYIGVKDSTGANKWSGGIDDVAIWNQPLTTAEIGNLYAKGLQGINAGEALLASPKPGLVSYYSFEEHADDTAAHYFNSSSTKADNLSAVGGISYTQGMAGMAARLDGGYFAAPYEPISDVNLGDTFTIEAWINPDTIGTGSDDWQRLVLNWGGSGELSYHFALRGDNVNLFLSTDGSNAYEVATGGAVAAGEWQHIAAVSDGTTAWVYLDGQEVGSGALPGSLFQTTTGGLGVGDSFGSAAPQYRYGGLLDELAVWNVALTPRQLSGHYAAGPAGYGLHFIPEPSALLLLTSGAALLALVRRRRQRPAQHNGR